MDSGEISDLRRCSARIKKLNSNKALCLSPAMNGEAASEKKKQKRRKTDKLDLNSEVRANEDEKPEMEVAEAVDEKKEAAVNGVVPEVAGIESAAGDKSSYAVVKETIRSFYSHYLHFVQEEEKRCGRGEADVKPVKSGSKDKNGGALEDNSKQSSRRPDLKALTKMLVTKTALRPNRIGSIPGIDVGHQFLSRAEMVVAGFHSHWLNGIDYVGKSGSKIEEFSGYELPVTVAIVLSGQYEDDLDNCEDVVYTGQGGNDLLGKKHQISDQKMLRGNLGLKVVKYWADKGVSGFTVYKFRLKRLEGQPSFTTAQVQFARGQIPKSISEIRGLVCEDITGGQEKIPIPATNVVDDPPVAPTGLTYCSEIELPKGMKLPSAAPGCDCKGDCINSRNCSCAKLNGTNFAYVHRDGGRIIEAKSVVFECGPNCGCGIECVNRTSQRGLRYRLEVYRTPKKGWAVRSWDFIPSGAPVCEYIGKLKRTSEVDIEPQNNYLFDIDCLQTMRGLDGREKRLGDVSLPSYMNSDEDMDGGPKYCLDAGSSGNVARYINHSCQPNLFVQCVLSTHHDANLARVLLFASDNIPPLQELSYDYGYALDSVLGPDGKIKQLECFCGAADCRKRMF